jgi:hypothetical protein
VLKNGLQAFRGYSTHLNEKKFQSTYCNGFDQRVARQQLSKHGQRATMVNVSLVSGQMLFLVAKQQRTNEDAG